jgi:hypothetical protein
MRRMARSYDWSWVEAQVAQAIGIWQDCSAGSQLNGPYFSQAEQLGREEAYDHEMRMVEREAKRAPQTKADRLTVQDHVVASFARFSATALGLQNGAVQLLTKDFLPAGVRLGRWARRFDSRLSRAAIVQACRNAWTACGLQALFGERIAITPSILGYSLLYPYSDNYLDAPDVSVHAKRDFSERFRNRLRGDKISGRNDREAATWALVSLIEGQYPRMSFPEVFDSLLAIHRAQEESIAQVGSFYSCAHDRVLRISCAKGGTSVLADASLVRGALEAEEGRFSFEWGTLLQLGDDLQDVREDLQRGSITLFSLAAALNRPLDDLVMQLLSFSERIGSRMDQLSNGSQTLKTLLAMSWRSLIFGAIADSYKFFTPGFLKEAERCSPFRFSFLRRKRKRLSSRHGLYTILFDAFLEDPEREDNDLPLPDWSTPSCGNAAHGAKSAKSAVLCG